MNGLETAVVNPDKEKEINLIREVSHIGKMNKVKPTKVDLWIESYRNEFFLFDIKTAKPNAGAFREFKRTLLEWCAAVFAVNPDADIKTMIAIPYNPYEPEPYKRWTIRGMLDLDNELIVGKEFWDFLGGEGSYEGLLDCFEKVGIDMRDEIDNYFSNFKN